MEISKTREKLLLIDANSIIHRAFHALPPFKTPSGSPSGALYGLASIVIKTLREREPKYIAVAFDRPEPTVRKKEFKEYKGTRKPTDESLIVQLKEAPELLEAFGIKSVDFPGWEADDIVATLAKKFSEIGKLDITILSGDLDILQVVSPNISVEVPQKGISNTVIYDEEAVMARFNLPPKQLSDYKGLVGDTSDNIPGVPGIGPKTAEKLINKHGPLEDMYKEIEEIGMTDDRLRKKLLEHKDQALLSKRLAILNKDLPIEITLEDIDNKKAFDKEKAIAYAEKLGSETLTKRIENDLTSRYNE